MKPRTALAMLALGCGNAPTPTLSHSAPLPPASSIGVTPPPPLPGKARLLLSTRKAVHFLGENTLLDFCVENTSPDAITLEVGGDYRGSSRSLRFKLEVRDEHGALMPDPDPNPFNVGGMSYSPKLAPNEQWCASLPIFRYARIDAAGTYVVRATHDLGWPAGTAPSAELQVRFAMPNAAEAEMVVTHMEKLPTDPSSSAGKKAIDYADLSALRYDVYVAPLLVRARGGKAEAVDGLSQIPTVAATRALVDLLSDPNVVVSSAAADGLSMRLPDPALAGALGPRNPFDNEMTEQRKYLSGVAWRPEFTNEVRAAAKKFLAAGAMRDGQHGAFMLEAVGTVADGTELTAALTAAIEKTKTEAAEAGIYPVPRGACQELLRAAQILVARGLVPVAAPKSHGEIAVWLVALATGARPAGWENTLAAALRHPVAYVRQLAMERSPSLLSLPLEPLVKANLQHADPDVQIAAAQLAERAKLTALAPDVLKIVAHVKDSMRLNISINAARTLGSSYEAMQVVASRLGETEMWTHALSELVSLLEQSGYGSNEAPAGSNLPLVARWKAFLTIHKADIEAHRSISLDDPTVKADLVPTSWKLRRKDGREWP